VPESETRDLSSNGGFNGVLTILSDNGCMSPAVTTSYDIAFWFLDRARKDDSYLQPRALQCLLFLAQAHFAAAYKGKRLMPSVFVIDDAGPLDPNLYRMFENGRPTVTEFPISEGVVVFLDAIWRRYRHDDALRLEQIIARAGRKERAVEQRNGAEISIAAMRRMFGRDEEKLVSAEPERGPKKRVERRELADDIKLPPSGARIMTLHTGKKVAVKRWMPARKSLQE